MWPSVILSGISLATGPDKAAMTVVYKWPGKNTTKRREEEEPRSDTVLLVNSYVQVWYADIWSLPARVGHVSKHDIRGLLSGHGSEISFFFGGGEGGRQEKFPYRSERTCEPRKPIPIPWSAVIDSRMHVSGKEGEDSKNKCLILKLDLITIHVDWPRMMIYLSASLRFSNESHLVFVHAIRGTGWGSNLNWLFLASQCRSSCTCNATCVRNGVRPIFQKRTVLPYFGITQPFRVRDTMSRLVPFSGTRAMKLTYHVASVRVFNIPGESFRVLAYWTPNGCCVVILKERRIFSRSQHGRRDATRA